MTVTSAVPISCGGTTQVPSVGLRALQPVHARSSIRTAVEASKIVRELFMAYRNDVRLLPPEWRENLPDQDPARSRHIGDFLAGMTDRYATDRHREHCGKSA